jgi:ABC-type dipeptide/oligopeptide/nickel transport system ATPase component
MNRTITNSSNPIKNSITCDRENIATNKPYNKLSKIKENVMALVSQLPMKRTKGKSN